MFCKVYNCQILPTIRHDGWTGDKMARFCEALADTAVVAEACDEAGMSTQSAYKLRRRNPVFAAGWDAALTIARERLADTLLARSIEGNAELIYRDNELVGRREVIDNRLGLAILRRLDRLAETGRATSGRGERPMFPGEGRPSKYHFDGAQGRGPGAAQQRCNPPAILNGPVDWDLVIEALRTRDPDDIAGALAVIKSHEVDEVDDPPVSLIEGDTDGAGLDLSDRCWRDDEGVWMTDFPPPQGFDGYESCDYGEESVSYERECSPEETAILERDEAELRAEIQAEDAALRDRWFELLAEETGEGAEED